MMPLCYEMSNTLCFLIDVQITLKMIWLNKYNLQFHLLYLISGRGQWRACRSMYRVWIWTIM